MRLFNKIEKNIVRIAQDI
uniref:Uncharacterized protein n=1 Tax=Moumouvirus sp. 'Monve' TaxID=1128131 RepID=H2EFF3_9VIRU|nr:hypothetical protein mv_R1016 [Moumouvirus Monve]